jgi:diacylglycerol kinase (ATP)
MKNRVASFGFAFNGLFCAIVHEVHMKIHLCALVLVILSGFYLEIDTSEWIAVTICCGLVIAAELFNTAIERICDLISTEKMPQIKYIKDISAAAVLVLSITSLCVAALILTRNLQL